MTKITFWGTRGSIATPLADRMKSGGDTSCVEVVTHEEREHFPETIAASRDLEIQL